MVSAISLRETTFLDIVVFHGYPGHSVDDTAESWSWAIVMPPSAYTFPISRAAVLAHTRHDDTARDLVPVVGCNRIKENSGGGLVSVYQLCVLQPDDRSQGLLLNGYMSIAGSDQDPACLDDIPLGGLFYFKRTDTLIQTGCKLFCKTRRHMLHHKNQEPTGSGSISANTFLRALGPPVEMPMAIISGFSGFPLRGVSFLPVLCEEAALTLGAFRRFFRRVLFLETTGV